MTKEYERLEMSWHIDQTIPLPSCDYQGVSREECPMPFTSPYPLG